MESLKYWTIDQFDIASYKWRILERVNKTHTSSGSDNTGLCKYTYNELGFRGDSIYKNGFKVLSIGCSNTEGIGVNNDETWPHFFTSLISNGVNMNCGRSGRSNDYISRCLLTFYDLIRPDLVLIMYTSPHRKEFYRNNGDIEPFHIEPCKYFKSDTFGRIEHTSLLNISNPSNNFQNWYKNHLLIKYFLETKKCNWLWNGWFLDNDYSDENRFDGEYHPFLDKAVDGVHPGPKTNKLYAEKLYNYTKKLGYLKKNKYF